MPGSPLASSGHWGGVCPGPESPSRRQKSLTGYRNHPFCGLGLQAAPAGALLTPGEGLGFSTQCVAVVRKICAQPT